MSKIMYMINAETALKGITNLCILTFIKIPLLVQMSKFPTFM